MEQSFTLVFTDLVDSTALNSRLGDQRMAVLWESHDAGSRALLRQWRGREIDRSDGFLAIFDAITDAAGFLADYHRLLPNLPAPIEARAGMHVGPILLRQSAPEDVTFGAKPFEVVGLAKAHCARLMALASGRQTLVSREAAHALSSSSYSCHSRGYWRLKGIGEPVEVFELAHTDASNPPPCDSEKAYRVLQVNGQWVAQREVPKSLPTEMDRFFGRHRNLAELGRLADSGYPLITIAGAGGMGKTRLALRYAWGWLGDYSGGVYFCDLSQAKNSDDVTSSMARALKVPLGTEPLTQLTDAIGALGRCLLVLDNFEQVAACAISTVGRWLQGASHAQFLVTSRERLGLPGEQVLSLQSLDTEPAIALFHERARSASSDYRMDAGESAVSSLIQMLDGLPLAIELAAARVSVATPAQLLQLMGERFRLLASRAGRPDRQATLAATLEWSWELLSDVERCAMAQLSAFEGSFSLSAAEAVLKVSAAGPEPWSVDLLQSLIEKSLLRSTAEGRFQSLTCIREFAAEKLRAEGRFTGSGQAMAAKVLARHQRYFSQLDESAAIADGCVEVDNLVAACRNASEAGDVTSAVAALRLAWGALRLVGPFGMAVDLVERVAKLTELSPQDRASVHWVHGSALYAEGATDEARTVINRGLAIVPPGAPPRLFAQLYCSLGEILSVQGETGDAERHLKTAWDFAEQDGTASVRCQVLNAQGALAQEASLPDDARRYYGQAIEIAEGAGERRWQAAVLGNLAVLDMAACRYDDALVSNQQAMAYADAAGDFRWVGNAHCNLGLVYYEKGELALAHEHLSQALQVARRLGHRALEFMALCNLGLVCEKHGDLTKACEYHRAAVAGAEQIGDVRVEAQLRCCLGSALAHTGQHDEARRCLQRATELLARTHDQLSRGLVLCGVVENESLAGNRQAAALALQHLTQAMADCGAENDSELGRRYNQVRMLSRD